MTPKVTIGGERVIGSQPVRWALKSGTKPYIAQFPVTPISAENLKRLAPGPVTLRIEVRGRTPVEFQKLYIINVAPGENPHIFMVTLADRRYWWHYAHVNRGYNMRRRIGFRRTVAFDQPATQKVVERLWYAAWSLRNPDSAPPAGKFNAEQCLEDIIERAGRREFDQFGTARPNVTFEFTFKSLPIENLMVDDAGDDAVNRGLSFLPEAGLFITPKGDIVIYPKTAGGEDIEIAVAGAEKVGKGHVERVANAPVRPKEVHVLFTREVEVRFDFEEERVANSSETVAEGSQPKERILENVLPVPDFSLVVKGETLPQGTWITVDEALEAWINDDKGNVLANTLKITSVEEFHQIIRRAFMPFMDLWSAMGLIGQLQPNVDWAARISAILQHYRKTFRIPREWVDRYQSVRAYRVALVDPTTGTRAPATAWADYAVLPSLRGLFKAQRVDEELPYVVNVKGYPIDGDIGDNSKPAPAEVSVVDGDQGIIRVDYKIDPYRTYEMVLPSMVELNGSTIDADGYPAKPGPIVNVRNKQFPIAYDSVVLNSTEFPQLTKNFKMAVILTVVPAPLALAQNSDHLERIKVKSTNEELKNLVPGPAKKNLEDARGPVLEVRVGPSVEPARVQWLDERSPDIESIFQIDGPNVVPPDVRDITVNRGSQEEAGTEGASLDSIALGVAARAYAALVDRSQGLATTDFNATLRPSGWLDEVTFEIDTTGEGACVLRLPDQVPAINLMTFLPQSTRAIMMKLVQPLIGL